MRRIKVVHLDNLDVGLRVHLGNYMRYLQAQGYEVHAVCPPGRWLTHDTTILDGVRVKIVRFDPAITPLTDLRSLLQLVRYFRRERFDIVHTHTVKPGLLGRLAAAIAGVPIIIHTIHGLYLHDTLMSPRQYHFFKAIETLGSKLSHGILSQNHADIQTMTTRGICPPSKIEFLGNGIDLSRFDPQHHTREAQMQLRASLGIRPNEFVVGYMGRLVREKGIFEFIEAARLLKSRGVPAKYIVVGTPRQGENIISPQQMIREYGLEDDVLLLGYRDDIPELLSILNTIVLPSHGVEGIPRVLMEAAAMGVPAVATDARGNNEAVEHGVTGLLVPLYDSRAVADAIYHILYHPEEARAMGQAARKRAINQFDERFFFWKTDLMYRRLIRERLHLDPQSILAPLPSQAMPSLESVA